MIGALKPSDRAAIVRRVRRLKAADLSSVLCQVLSGIGAVQVFPDGLCIISDTVEVLDRVAAIIDQLEAAESVTWCVQLHILRLSDRDIRNLGLDVVPALDLAATLGAASQGIPAGLNVNLGATLKGLLDFANEKSRTMIVAEPLMLIVDGDTGTWQRSRQVPIESSVIDPRTGAISRSYDYRSAGLNVTVDLRESSWRSARVNFNVQLGDVISGGDGSGPPVIADQSLKVSADVYTGGVYLVGALREGTGNKGAAGALKFGDRQSSDSTEVVVFARVARIAGSLLPHPATEGPEQGGAPTDPREGGGAPAEDPEASGPALCPDPVANPGELIPTPAGPELPRLELLEPVSRVPKKPMASVTGARD
ncbi:hypothetical protein VT03_28110 [Planctomyces sp. SH-PL14]|nr:hypothetical protein VT03_28110 [Planctomyces sp. SH-PL14]